MLATPAHHRRPAPGAPEASAVAAMVIVERELDTPGISIPRPEFHLVARFGPSASGGLDVHAMGARQRVHRKLVRGGQQTVAARLRLGAHEAVLGVPASAVAGGVVALEDLWGAAAARQLRDRLGVARDAAEAALVLEGAIAERLATPRGDRDRVQLALAAAERLTSDSVTAVAAALGVSERHLRRVFRDVLGVSPKAFARLARFRRALRAARAGERQGWADIAAAAGYYDQAHLIADFRDIAGATPQALLEELRVSVTLG